MMRDSDAILASKCLSKLSQPQYKVPARIGPLLRTNLGASKSSLEDDDLDEG